VNRNIKIQVAIFLLAGVLFATKLLAWHFTGSVAILTDALEGLVNVFSGGVGLYSLYLSSRPRDRNHPYGHGKVEFISALLEGTLIISAGILIIYQAGKKFGTQELPSNLGLGMGILLITIVLNAILGFWAEKRGKETHSIALQSSGRHLLTDALTTIGILTGLSLLYYTGIAWLDPAVAVLFALVIIRSGYRILKKSLSGIMDELDFKLVEQLVGQLERNRHSNWIDFHNLRIVKYGAILHFDCHLTIPWYFDIIEGHTEIERLEKTVEDEFGHRVEMFAHIDPCQEHSCEICILKDCAHRKKDFDKRINWTVENISANRQHRIGKNYEL
jgi:cation diffusion facilitator family transporter